MKNTKENNTKMMIDRIDKDIYVYEDLKCAKKKQMTNQARSKDR